MEIARKILILSACLATAAPGLAQPSPPPPDERSLAYRYDSQLGWFPKANDRITYTGTRTFHIAHNAMGHIDAKMANAMAGAGVGLIFDILAAVAGVNTGGDFMRVGMNAGAGAYSQSFEAEADYVGLYLMARARMAVDEVPDFWRMLRRAGGVE